MDNLAPPRKSVELEDAGAHELQPSESDHESGHPKIEASEQSNPDQPPIPTTRVERVDAEPSHGEVPGTEAYEMRTADAAPDELEIIPESADLIDQSQPTVEESESSNGSPTSITNRFLPTEIVPTPSPTNMATCIEEHTIREPSCDSRKTSVSSHEKDDEEAFGDEFDDFESGDEVDDFGDFDEQETNSAAEDSQNTTSTLEHAASRRDPALQTIIFHWDELKSHGEIATAMQPIIKELLPVLSLEENTADVIATDNNESLLTERSQSLWAQLVAPPPIQQPNWVQSRIRRLFLVSLGVPVDLDEILPASKQKKLVLPSLEVDSDSPSRHGHPVTSVTHATSQQADQVVTSAAASGSESEHKKKVTTSPALCDLNAARRICSTTDAALKNLSVEELKAHLAELNSFSQGAKYSLKHWISKRDSAQRDKATFEEVIENLVKHAKRVRR